jgi:hypothetical protein
MYKPFLYSKIQKFISYFLIFAILFLNSFHIPVFFKLQAEEIINYNLISIIVDEDTYSNLS